MLVHHHNERVDTNLLLQIIRKFTYLEREKARKVTRIRKGSENTQHILGLTTFKPETYILHSN